MYLVVMYHVPCTLWSCTMYRVSCGTMYRVPCGHVPCTVYLMVMYHVLCTLWSCTMYCVVTTTYHVQWALSLCTMMSGHSRLVGHTLSPAAVPVSSPQLLNPACDTLYASLLPTCTQGCSKACLVLSGLKARSCHESCPESCPESYVTCVQSQGHV